MADRWKMAMILTLAVLTLALGETAISRGMKQAGAAETTGWWAFARESIGNGWVVSGGLLLGLHLLIYATALSRFDLSFVMPITAASYPLGTLLARFFLHEEVNLARWVGTTVIAVGVAVVAWGEAQGGR
jgi:uncharacterized membrane protein